MRWFIASLGIALIFGCSGEQGAEKEGSKQAQEYPLNPNDNSASNQMTMVDEPVSTEKMIEKFENAATQFTNAYRSGDYKTYINYLHPALIESQGGKDKCLKTLEANPDNTIESYRKWKIGPVRSITDVKDKDGKRTGWYCVLPITKWPKNAPDSVAHQQWMAGQSLDDGQHCYFMDITGKEEGQAYQIMPDLRYLFQP